MRYHLNPLLRRLCTGLLACTLAAGTADAQAVADEGSSRSCGSSVRSASRGVLCGAVIDTRTGLGLPGGFVQFEDAAGAQAGALIGAGGRFYIFGVRGPVRLLIQWSCRRSVVLDTTIALPAGRGAAHRFEVRPSEADTACRIRQALEDTTSAAVERWLSRGPCFEVRLGTWHPPLWHTEGVPSLVILDSSKTGLDANAWYRLWTSGNPPTRWPSAQWHPRLGDSLLLSWGDGYAGVTLTLGPSGDSLAGRGIWEYDVIELDSLGFRILDSLPKGPASARRTDCPR